MKALVGLAGLASLGGAKAYNLAQDWSGQNFFQGWDFFGSWDNLTLGNVWWQDEANATDMRLAYISDAGTAILRVDNTTTIPSSPANLTRNSVRITTQESYPVGSLFIMDAVHMPFGCSVWPAFWTKGPDWPDHGEIDIVEGVNLFSSNQAALHTLPGCVHPPLENNGAQTGRSGDGDCSTGAGCIVTETKPNSFGPGFNAAGGGVFAMQFDVTGIFIWFWSRPNIPASITFANATSPITDLSQWGTPTAAYPAGNCNITEFFGDQQIVIDITLCGDWAGIGPVYNTSGCHGSTGICYYDNVVGNGSNYADAYFEINYVRAYTLPGTILPEIVSSPISSSTTSSNTATSTVDDGGVSVTHVGGALGLREKTRIWVAAAAAMFAICVLA